MSRSELAELQIIDVRPIPKPQRHPLIFAALDELAVGASVVVHNDHNPIPLRQQVAAIYGAQFAWHYLEEGPDEFRLQFTRRHAAPADWQRAQSGKFSSSLPLVPENAAASTCSATRVDLLAACGKLPHSGPQWSHESDDLDLTLLSWEQGRRIEAHHNREVDVVWIGIEGSGEVTIDGTVHHLRPGVALLIPKGCERALHSTAPRLSYLSVHRRRRGLMPINNLKGRRQ